MSADRASENAVTAQLAQPVSLRVLGGVSATRLGRPVELGGRMQRSVLAILLSARGRAIPAQRVTDLVWGPDVPANPSAALQSYVSHLRRALEPDRSARDREAILRLGPGGYSVHLPTAAVDAWQFEELVTSSAAIGDPVRIVTGLRQATDLWAGRPFAEYAGQPWADAEAARCLELHAVAVDRLLGARLEIEPAALLVPDLEAAVAATPLREERWRLLALALYRAHRQGDALGAIRRAKQTLAENLGIDPSPALRELEGQLLIQAPELLPKPLAVATVAEPAAVAVPSATPRAPAPADFVDREGEVAQIDATLRRAAKGQGAVLLIEGPAGIGKTRLLTEARNAAEQSGRTVLTARGSQLEQSFAFGAVRQLLEPLVTVNPDLFNGAAEAARSVFGGTPAMAGSDGVFGALHGLYWLTVNAAAKEPLLLAVDDLQWCDTASLRWFAYLAHRLDGLPVAIMSTLRTGEEAVDASLIADLRHDAATTTVRPWPLSISGVGDLVRQTLGAGADRAFIAACHRTTGGNPLLLRQVLRALEADEVCPEAANAEVVSEVGSRAIASLVLTRLKRLHQDAVSVARAVAVLGDGAPLPAIAELAKVSEDEATEAVTALIRTEILRDEYPIGFVHPLIAEAVYGDMPVVQQQVHHDLAARALDSAGASPESVAAHLLHVPPRGDQWVCEVLRRAATLSRERGTTESAVTYLRRALQEPPASELRAETLLELGGAENLVDGPSAVQHLTEAYELLPPGEQRGVLAPLLAQTLIFAGGKGSVTDFVRKELPSLDPDSDEYQALVALGRTGGHMHGTDPAQWPDTVPIVGGGPGARRLAASKAWDIVCACGDRAEVVRLGRFALEDDVLRQYDSGLFWVVAAFVLEMADEDIGDFWIVARDRALAEGSLLSMLAVNLWWGRSAWRSGDLREAEALLSIAREQTAQWGNVIGDGYYDAFHSCVKVERGDLAGARRVVDAATPERYFGDSLRMFRQYECGLLIAEGRYAEALAQLDEIEPMNNYIFNPIHRCWHEYRAAALAGLGRIDEAIEAAGESVRRARKWGANRSIGTALGRYGAIPGPHSEQALREAIDVLTGTTGTVWLARAQLNLARLIGERKPEAIALLRQARDNADTSGANGVRRQCELMLDECGVDRKQGPPRLSMFERRIAQLTLEGRDDSSIAQALMLTPRAVQLVMSDIRARVGSQDEAALAAAVAS